jgi:hypothetical protein
MAHITKQQTKNKKTVYKKTITDKQRQKTGIIVPKINLDKVIKKVAIFSPVLQQLAKNS